MASDKDKDNMSWFHAGVSNKDDSQTNSWTGFFFNVFCISRLPFEYEQVFILASIYHSDRY